MKDEVSDSWFTFRFADDRVPELTALRGCDLHF